MDINKYLRIKQAKIGYYNAEHLRTTHPEEYKAWRRTVPITNTINMLADVANIQLPDVMLLPGVSDYKSKSSKGARGLWPDLNPIDFNGIPFEAFARSINKQKYPNYPDYFIASGQYDPVTILHELGHTIDNDKNKTLYKITEHLPVIKRFDTLMHERGADAEARNFINKTIDDNPELRNRLLTAYRESRNGPYGFQTNYYRNNIPIAAGSAIGALGLGAGLGYAGYKGGNWLAKQFGLKDKGWGAKALRWGGALAGGLGGIYAGDIAGAYLGKKYVQNFNRGKTEETLRRGLQRYNDNYNEPGGWRDGSKPGTKLMQDLMDYAMEKDYNKPWYA